MSQPDVRFAILGCGVIGNRRFESLPAGSVVAAFDVVAARAGALAARAGCLAASSVEEALATPCDAVVVATRNCDLAALAGAAIRAGKHVLLEKPGAVSVAEIRGLASLLEKTNPIVRVGFNLRRHPALRKAWEIHHSGVLGPLMFIRGRYGHGGRLGYEREWRADPRQSGGGELIDQGVHLIDLAGWFLLDPGEATWQRVEGHRATYFWDMPVDDNAFVSLRNARGNTAWLQASCTEWKNLFSFEIYGRDGKLQVDGLGGSYGVERLAHYQMRPEMGPPDTVIYEFPGPDRSWTLEMNDFLEDIRLGRKPDVGLEEAEMALAVVEAISG